MALVVDASVTMAWCFEDEVSAYSEAILERVGREGAIVPSIWLLEVANVLLVAERGARIDQAKTAEFCRLLQDLPIEIDQSSAAIVLGPLLATGRVHGLSAYDAAYLELAARNRLPIASEDEGLKAAADAAGVSICLGD